MKTTFRLLIAGLLAVMLTACKNTPDYVGTYTFSGTAVINMDGAITQQTVNGTFTLTQTGSDVVTFSGDLNGTGTVDGDILTIPPTHIEQTIAGVKQTADSSVEPIKLSGSSLHIVVNTVVVQEMDGRTKRTTTKEDYIAVKR